MAKRTKNRDLEIDDLELEGEESDEPTVYGHYKTLYAFDKTGNGKKTQYSVCAYHLIPDSDAKAGGTWRKEVLKVVDTQITADLIVQKLTIESSLKREKN